VFHVTFGGQGRDRGTIAPSAPNVEPPWSEMTVTYADSEILGESNRQSRASIHLICWESCAVQTKMLCGYYVGLGLLRSVLSCLVEDRHSTGISYCHMNCVATFKRHLKTILFTAAYDVTDN